MTAVPCAVEALDEINNNNNNGAGQGDDGPVPTGLLSPGGGKLTGNSMGSEASSASAAARDLNFSEFVIVGISPQVKKTRERQRAGAAWAGGMMTNGR